MADWYYPMHRTPRSCVHAQSDLLPIGRPGMRSLCGRVALDVKTRVVFARTCGACERVLAAQARRRKLFPTLTPIRNPLPRITTINVPFTPEELRRLRLRLPKNADLGRWLKQLGLAAARKVVRI